MKDNIDVSDGDTLLIPMPNVFLLLLDIAFISVILIGMFVFLFILLLLHDPVLLNMLSYFIVILFCFIFMEIKNRRYKPFVMTRDSIRFESHKRTGIWLDLSQSGPVSLIFHQSDPTMVQYLWNILNKG